MSFSSRSRASRLIFVALGFRLAASAPQAISVPAAPTLQPPDAAVPSVVPSDNSTIFNSTMSEAVAPAGEVATLTEHIPSASASLMAQTTIVDGMPFTLVANPTIGGDWQYVAAPHGPVNPVPVPVGSISEKTKSVPSTSSILGTPAEASKSKPSVTPSSTGNAQTINPTTASSKPSADPKSVPTSQSNTPSATSTGTAHSTTSTSSATTGTLSATTSHSSIPVSTSSSSPSTMPGKASSTSSNSLSTKTSVSSSAKSTTSTSHSSPSVSPHQVTSSSSKPSMNAPAAPTTPLAPSKPTITIHGSPAISRSTTTQSAPGSKNSCGVHRRSPKNGRGGHSNNSRASSPANSSPTAKSPTANSSGC